MDNNSLVSILIPYYNDRKYLKLAVESVLNQTYKNFELILLNHATKDDCREIAESFVDNRIKHIDMPENLGAGSGILLIEFLKLAQGKYIKTFCADDIMYPDCIKDLVEYMESNPDKDFAFGDIEYVDKNGKSLNDSWFNARQGFSLNNTEIGCIRRYFKGVSFLPYIANIIKKEALIDIQLDKSFIMLFDMSLWLKLLIKNKKIGYLNKYVAGYRIHEFQMCSKNIKKIAFRRSYFEINKFMEIFLQIDDIQMIKLIFEDNQFLKQGILINKEDLKFIICYEMFIDKNPSVAICGYKYLYEFMQDDETRKYLEDKFNFGIKEFREIYSQVDEVSQSPSIKELTIFQLLFLLIRKIWKIITFQKYRNVVKEYSL